MTLFHLQLFRSHLIFRQTRGVFFSSIANEFNCKLLVVGGGTGGCSIAAKFAKKLNKNDVVIVEPSDKHYYQPMFTLVAGGMKPLSETWKPMSCVLPGNAKWIQSFAKSIVPKENYVLTHDGIKINYQYLILAAGIELDYTKIPGCMEGLLMPDSGVCSNYSAKYVEKTYKSLQNFKEGHLVFTFPNTPVKCAGAPQKICYIAEEYLNKVKLREKATLTYNTSLGVLFGAKHYADALWKVVKKRGINVNLRTNLVSIEPDKKIAYFENLDKPNDKAIAIKYSFLHVTPPMYPPKVLKSSPDLTDAAGYLEVDPCTMRHKLFPNIFGLGDCTNAPTSKTAAAAAAQCGIVEDNLSAVMSGKPLPAKYDGYTSCPLVTGYSTCILAEFDYKQQPLETFPFDQAKERKSMFFMKKYLMPLLYWWMMLRGIWNGPAVIRIANPFKK